MHDTLRPAAWSVCSRHALRNTLLSVEILLGTKPGMHVLVTMWQCSTHAQDSSRWQPLEQRLHSSTAGCQDWPAGCRGRGCPAAHSVAGAADPERCSLGPWEGPC